MTPRICTLTGNLLWEKTLRFIRWEPGHTQRATDESFQVGGKGINVSKMLDRLRAPNTALYFAGGATGLDCQAWLDAHRFHHHAFAAATPTRTGLIVRAPGRRETAFFSPDTSPGADAFRACARHLDTCPADAVLAVCGSLPGWATAAARPLRASLARRALRGRLALDTYGPPLRALVRQPVALVKINRDEFGRLLPARVRRRPPAARLVAAGKLWPSVRAWVVTDGPRPVWYCEAGAMPACLPPPPVREVSATGSGDVFFACILREHFQRGRPLRDAIRFALPAAAANAASPGIADFALNKVRRLRS